MSFSDSLVNDKIVSYDLSMTRIKRETRKLQEWVLSWQNLDELADATLVNKRTLYRFRKTGQASLTVLDKLSMAKERMDDEQNNGKAA